MGTADIVRQLQGLSIGISAFESLRADRKVYVDKTAFVAELAAWPVQKILLARPERFGKTLLSSTFRSLFANNLRDFDGLSIAKTWKDRTYPVVGMDLSGLPQFRDEASFRSALIAHLLSAFGSVGFTYDATSRISFFDQFRIWLAELPLNSLVLIIDEYDAPLTALLGNDEAFSTARDILCEFYARLKEGEGALRFLLMTGMTRFHQTSVFSTLNNLTDISADPHFGTLMGFTEEELVQYFAPHLRTAAGTLGVSGVNALIDKMAEMYGGFCFDRSARTQVFHPGSVLRFLNAPELGFVNYWRESEKGLSCLKHACSSGLLDAPEASLGPFYADFSELALPADGRYVNSKSLLLQAGCLTIKRAEGEVVELGCPNREVAESIGRKDLPA